MAIKRIRYFDWGSFTVILTTLILFLIALFQKGLTHDLLLESGIFLVSVKVILLSYQNKVESKAIQEKLDAIEKKIK